MSRSGYNDDCDGAELRLYRLNVERAIKRRPGQAFLREMAVTLDAMPVKRLVAMELQQEETGEVCAIGAVGKARGVDMADLNPEEPDDVAAAFKIASTLVREIVYVNDEYYQDRHGWRGPDETPEERFTRVRRWVAEQIVA